MKKHVHTETVLVDQRAVCSHRRPDAPDLHNQKHVGVLALQSHNLQLQRGILGLGGANISRRCCVPFAIAPSNDQLVLESLVPGVLPGWDPSWVWLLLLLCLACFPVRSWCGVCCN